MRYYKIIEDDYVSAIGTGTGGIEITQGEYDAIRSAIDSKPSVDGFDHHIMDGSMEYEAFRLPLAQEEGDQEISASLALNIITGGAINDA